MLARDEKLIVLFEFRGMQKSDDTSQNKSSDNTMHQMDQVLQNLSWCLCKEVNQQWDMERKNHC